MNPLESAIAKADWAHSHLDRLDAEVLHVFGPKMQRIRRERDTENSRYVYRRNIRQSPKHQFGLMVGDIASMLRASLDHIAYQLALQTGTNAKSLEHIYFPLLKKPDDRNFRQFTRHFKPEAVKQVERFQPYHAPKPQADRLFAISEIARIDKHRHINIIVETLGWNPREIPGGGQLDFSFDDTGVVAIVVGAPEPEEEFEPEISFEPGFELIDEDAVPPEHAIYHYSFGYLRDAYNIIRNDVIPTFARILPETE